MSQEYLQALRALPSHGPAVEIVYDELSHTIKVPVADTGITNVAAAVANFWLHPLRGKPMKDLPVLSGISGRIRPGTATLIIGNPGGGKTTFLRFLAGRDKTNGGSLTWNGEEPWKQASGANVGKIAAMAPQADIHEPLMSVRETFKFVVDSCMADLPATATESERTLRSKVLDHVLDTLGLRECDGTLVGDDLNRGISGGQKKRVTLGEALLTGARVLCLDEVTNGLDAAVACDIVRFLCDWAHTTQGTVVAALQQVTPEIFRAFDDVIVLSNGYQLYHGPVTGLGPYLSSLGFVCPDYMDVADYALAVAVSPAFAAEEYKPTPEEATASGYVAPTLLTREALAQAWKEYASKQQQPAPVTGGVVLATPQDKAQYGVPHVHSSARHMGLLVARQARLVVRNPAVSFGRIFQFVILAAIFGSIFWKISEDNFTVKFSLAIFAASAVSFASFAEIPVIFTSKRTAARQMEAAMYKPTAYVLSIVINALPASIISTFLFGTILYWMTGFANDAGRYFFFVLALIAHELAVGALFRLYAFALPGEELAQAAAGITTGAALVFGGFYIPYNKIPKFMWPLYYLSPFSWTVRSMVNSEFTAEGYSNPLAPPFVMTPKGEVYLDSFSFQKGMDWKWGGIAYCIAMFFVFAYVMSPLIVAHTRIREAPGSQRIADDKFLAAAVAAKASATPKAGSESPDGSGIHTPSTGKVSPPPDGGRGESVGAEDPATPSQATPTTVPNPLTVSVTTGPASASSALPFTPATLAFKDITYAVKLPNGSSKTLLRGVSGYAAPGTMTALMGASGAGKTTLLDVLAFRKTQGTIGGDITVNGCKVTAVQFSRMSGFAEQEDVHADYATVREAIEFSAGLRLPAAVPATTRQAFVAEVLALLELQPLADRRTGSLSQGERKRLTIGVELAANPPVLFLDEPTTGLDARSAAVVMRVIRNIASTGRTVIATIHQPSAEVFFAFDGLLCLIPGGYQTFLGPLHGPHKRAEKLSAFLEGVPGVQPLPHGVNPATWMLEEMASLGEAAKNSSTTGSGDKTPTPPQLVLRDVDGQGDKATADSTPSSTPVDTDVEAAASKASCSVDLPAIYASSPLAKLNADVINKAMTQTKEGLPQLGAQPGLPKHLRFLFVRMMKYMWRNTLWNGLRLFVFVVLSLFFGLLYLNIDDSDQAGVFGKIATALNSILFVSIISFNTGLPNYARLRSVYYREKAAGFYSPIAYPLSLIFTELPWTAFFSLVYLSINYFLVGFTTTGKGGPFFTAYLATVLTPWWYAIIAMGMIAFFPFPLLANIFGGLTIQLSILFAGVNLSVNELPEGWRWMYYADGFAHALRLFMLPQYAEDDADITIYEGGRPSIVKRLDFLELRMGTTPDKRWEALGWLCLIVGGGAVLATIFYTRINHQKR